MRQLPLLLAGLTLVAGIALQPTRARACGGFFCDNSQPVNQAAERIIFSQDADGEVTALIQIQYQGEAERFAWMLPVQGVPEVGVSSDAAFLRLQQATNPTYRMNVTVEGECAEADFSRGPFAAGGADAGAAGFDASAAADAGPVAVLDEGSVGPYDFVIVSVRPDTEDPAEEAITWLTDNGYDVSDFGGDLLRPYLAAGMNLLAFRLTKGNAAGSIRPVRISFGVGVPSIPLRPTAVAASDDMGVLVWVLGDHRAVPANYRSLEINEAILNWFSPGSNYDAVVTQAANEAGGQGFVTEMAGDASPLEDALWQEFEQNQWDGIAAADYTGRHDQLISDSLRFQSFDGALDVYRRHLDVPEGLDGDVFYACIGCYLDRLGSDIEGFDPAAFVTDFEEGVIAPMADTAALFADRYVTRLYTTMSADEMTMDPIFDFNQDLGDHDRNHVAERIIECDSGVSQFEAPWRTILPSGETVRGSGNSWPIGMDDMPANRRVRRVGTEGEGEIIEDNVASIRSALADNNARNPRRTFVPGVAGGGGCSAAGGAGGLATLAFLGLGLVVARRRKAQG